MQMRAFSDTWRILSRSWRVLLGFITPFALIPFLLDYDNKASLCAYVLILMVIFWIFEPINLYMTALIPVALFPLLGIASSDEVSYNYMKATNMMFFGGLIMGLALEHSNLHNRVALKVIIFFGSSVKLLMAGIMLVTMFLSMWVSNTATTSMMLPIVDAILSEIYSNKEASDENKEQLRQNGAIPEITANETAVDAEQACAQTVAHSNQNTLSLKVLRKTLMLSIAYSANIGGTATLTGTGTNLVLQEVFQTIFPTSHALTFTSWFIYAFPSALVTIILSWTLLVFFFLRNLKESPESGIKIRQLSRKKYAELGPISFHEYGVMIHFVILVLLWFFRHPGIYMGWADLLTNNKSQIKDGTPAILIAISMFLFPANLHQFYGPNRPKQIERLLNWKVIHKNMGWGVIFLLGGGFALAYGTDKSGLSAIFSRQLEKIDMSPLLATVVLVVTGASVTEMASNVATANVVLPVICHLAVHMQVNPLLLVVPTTIGISFAFMFPVATPPNALVFEYLNMNVVEMLIPGFFMNVIAVTTQVIFINTFGRVVFDLSHFPDWAHINITSTESATF